MSTPDERGLKVARAFSIWHLGDPAWADMIITAYLKPDEVERQLKQDKEES